MEFTKEEIEIAKRIWDKYSTKYNIQEINSGFEDYLDSLLEPKRKKIVVEIEYEPIRAFINEQEFINLSVNDVRDPLKVRMNKEFNIKVTELPEVFTREDMVEFGKYFKSAPFEMTGKIFDSWLSERDNNLNKK